MARPRSNEVFAGPWKEEVWERRNLDAIDDLDAEDSVGYYASRPEPVRGPGDVRESVETQFSGFADAEIELEQIAVEGDWFAQRSTATGTQRVSFWASSRPARRSK